MTKLENPIEVTSRLIPSRIKMSTIYTLHFFGASNYISDFNPWVLVILCTLVKYNFCFLRKCIEVFCFLGIWQNVIHFFFSCLCHSRSPHWSRGRSQYILQRGFWGFCYGTPPLKLAAGSATKPVVGPVSAQPPIFHGSAGVPWQEVPQKESTPRALRLSPLGWNTSIYAK